MDASGRGRAEKLNRFGSGGERAKYFADDDRMDLQVGGEGVTKSTCD